MRDGKELVERRKTEERLRSASRVLGSLYLLVNFPSAADAVVAAVAGNGRQRLPQQPATATTS